MFDGTDSENNLLYTKCVAASKTDIAKAYYNEKKNITKTRINITLAQAIIAKRQILTKDFMF